MTVTREKQNYSYPRPNSGAPSDTESLNLGSITTSTESVNVAHLDNAYRVYRAPHVKASDIEELVKLKKSSGKKKLRRYLNRCSLQTLSEKDEDEDDFIVVMEPYKSPFARLLDDKDALEYWNTFIEKSEIEQFEIIRAMSNNCYKPSCESTNHVDKPGRISSRIRRTIKIKKNLSLDFVKIVEDDLIAFFKTTPSAIYIKYPNSSFDRLLLHGIAQYHRLHSVSLQLESGARRSVEVYNTIDNWSPAEYIITDFIKQLRN